MRVVGYSLDYLSLMALTIAVGFVVDDATVMPENITCYVEEGEEAGSTGSLSRGQPKHLALTRPFGRQVAEAGHSHSVRESPIDRCLDEIGRKKGERDHRVHLPHAAALNFGIRSGVGNEFVEPTAPPAIDATRIARWGTPVGCDHAPHMG